MSVRENGKPKFKPQVVDQLPRGGGWGFLAEQLREFLPFVTKAAGKWCLIAQVTPTAASGRINRWRALPDGRGLDFATRKSGAPDGLVSVYCRLRAPTSRPRSRPAPKRGPQ
jgi:hypothetical protein